MSLLGDLVGGVAGFFLGPELLGADFLLGGLGSDVIGAGLGSALGGLASGDSLGQSLGAGLMGGLGAEFLPALAAGSGTLGSSAAALGDSGIGGSGLGLADYTAGANYALGAGSAAGAGGAAAISAAPTFLGSAQAAAGFGGGLGDAAAVAGGGLGGLGGATAGGSDMGLSGLNLASTAPSSPGFLSKAMSSLKLGDIAQVGMGLNQISNANAQKKMLEQQLAQRQAAQAAAMAAMQNQNVSQLPGYGAGLQAVQRQMTAQGFQGSGNMAAALASYGGQQYQQNLSNMQALANSQGIDPSTYAQLQMQNQANMGAGINALMTPFGVGVNPYKKQSDTAGGS